MTQLPLFADPHEWDWQPGEARDHAARYSVGLFDFEESGFVVSDSAWMNIPLWQLRDVIRQLREWGYSARGPRKDGLSNHYPEADPHWLIERTDGKTLHEILEGWKR